jgi:hypothetical protein
VIGEVRCGSKTVLTALKWDVCFTSRTQTSASFAATVIGGHDADGQGKNLPEVPHLRPGVMAQARPATFASRRYAKNAVAALLLLE